MTSQIQRHVVSVAAAAMLMGAGARVACAQNALGSGDALDRNSQVGSGGRNAPRPSDPYAGRNAVVTGEVIGGREFRGRVGYTAPGDFRGSLGSNDLYRFQADSAWSSPAALRLSYGTYEQLRFGQNLGVIELSRSGAGATPDQLFQAPGPVSFSQLAESRLRIDNQMLTAVSSSRWTNALEPTTLVRATASDGRDMAIVASSVRGLALEQYDQRMEALGLSTYDQVRMREESAQTQLPGLPTTPGDAQPTDRARSTSALPADRVGVMFETRFDALRTDTDAAADARTGTGGPSDYDRILRNIADRYAREGDRNVSVDPAILRELHERYQDLRTRLTGQSDSDAGPRQTLDPTSGRPLPTRETSSQAPMSSPTPGRVDPRRPDDPRVPADQSPAQPGTDRETDPLRSIDVTRIGPALQHGEKVERLSSEQQGRFNELMMAAEEQLRSGDYLLAEQRFQRALRFSPGNPLAMAGVVNAQIGAGLYMPAAYSLRAMFSQHPEMIDTTYSAALLPSADRMAKAVETLQSRIDAGNERSLHGLVLAYLGRQSGNRTQMEQGIAAMEQEKPDDPLPVLLRTIWLTPAATTPTPTPDK